MFTLTNKGKTMGRMNKLGTHKTVVFTDEDGFTKVIYYTTNVVAFNNDKIVLNTGGFWTKSTKDRMNQASIQFRLGYSVYQSKGQWYVDYKGEKIPFESMTVTLERNSGNSSLHSADNSASDSIS